jgi:hypothetical protein
VLRTDLDGAPVVSERALALVPAFLRLDVCVDGDLSKKDAEGEAALEREVEDLLGCWKGEDRIEVPGAGGAAVVAAIGETGEHDQVLERGVEPDRR